MSKAKAAATPDCPMCGDNRAVHEEGERGYFCAFCRVGFDIDRDEGGDYSTHDPAWRLMREEARAERAKARERERRSLPVGFRKRRAKR